MASGGKTILHKSCPSVLPLESASAQELLAVTDPHDRLSALCSLLEQTQEDEPDD